MTGLLYLIGAAVGWWAWERSHRKTHPVPAGLQRSISLPHEQEFELYHNALSLCSMKTRVCLAELGIAYRGHHVDLIETGSYENIGRRFLAVNPAGTVPVLVHRGHPVYESHEQIRYAAGFAAPGHPSLVPDDADLRQRMEEWIDRSSLTGDPLAEGEKSAANAIPAMTVPLFATMIERIPVDRIAEGLLFHFDKRRPVMFLVLKARGIDGLPKLGPAVAMHRKSRAQLADHLDALEAQLDRGGGPWILGEQYSLADVSWLVIFERLRQVDSLDLFLGGDARPRCAEYWAKLRDRPAYRTAILDCSHPTIEYGTERLRAAKANNPALRRALGG